MKVMNRLCLAFIIFISFQTLATKVDPRTWAQLSLSADFIGIIECTKSGGIVAEYQVIQTIKGLENTGDLIRLRMATDYWGGHFPTALVGERYLITGFKENAPIGLISTSSGGSVPLWARDLPYDYRLPLSSGIMVLSPNRKGTPFSFSDSHLKFYWGMNEETGAELLVKNIQGLLAATPEEQDLFILKELYKKYEIDEYRSYVGEPVIFNKYQWLEQVKGYQDATELVNYIWNISGRLNILEQGPYSDETAQVVYDLISSVDQEEYQLKYYNFRNPNQTINNEENKALNLPAITNLDIQQAEQNFKQYLKSSKWQETDLWYDAFDVLAVEKPDIIVDYLLQYSNTGKEWQDRDDGYLLASRLLIKGSPLSTNLIKSLRSAKSDQVRVASIVYLALNNPLVGVSELENLHHLKDLEQLSPDMKLWLSLNLVRHGNKKAVGDFFETIIFSYANSFDRLADGHMRYFLSNMFNRMQVLLSNSAAISGVPQPPLYANSVLEYNSSHRDTLTPLINWWKDNESKIILSDVWMKELRYTGVE